MFQSRRLGKKISGQGQKDVLGRTVSPHFTKLFIIIYSLIEITSGCNPLESVPEKKIITHQKPTSIQALYQTLAYIQLRTISEFLTFTEDEYKAMETGLIKAIRQLQ
jgi:hypothetical protein